jgi:surface polysaccharide O-acyltransferase-like enzyme
MFYLYFGVTIKFLNLVQLFIHSDFKPTQKYERWLPVLAQAPLSREAHNFGEAELAQ